LTIILYIWLAADAVAMKKKWLSRRAEDVSLALFVVVWVFTWVLWIWPDLKTSWQPWNLAQNIVAL